MFINCDQSENRKSIGADLKNVIFYGIIIVNNLTEYVKFS